MTARNISSIYAYGADPHMTKRRRHYALAVSPEAMARLLKVAWLRPKPVPEVAVTRAHILLYQDHD